MNHEIAPAAIAPPAAHYAHAVLTERAGTVRELAKAVVRDLPPDTPASQHRRCLSAQGITGALVQAASDPRVTVPYAELDADPWPLYCPPPARPRHRPA